MEEIAGLDLEDDGVGFRPMSPSMFPPGAKRNLSSCHEHGQEPPLHLEVSQDLEDMD